MKKIIILLFLFNIFCLHSKESKELNIRVVDSELNIPLEGVKISFSQIDTEVYTDSNGKAKILIDDSFKKIIIVCSLIGYETLTKYINDFNKEVIIKLNLSSEIEGKELVIEDYYESEDKIGASIQLDKEEMRALVMRGRIEDVINAIKTLPGVSYSAKFHSDLSVRGGYPDEIGAIYDGFFVRWPFYWNGGASMFNPNIINSAIFSNGIFSAKYGMVMSGLISTESIISIYRYTIDSTLGIAAVDSFVQLPVLKNKMGFLLGGRVTYLEATIAPIWRLMGNQVPTPPYIREAHINWFYKPNERFKWYINSFFGTDGIGMGKETERGDSDIIIYQGRDNKIYHAIAFSGFDILACSKVNIKILLGYEFLFFNKRMQTLENGEKDYSDDFKSSKFYNPKYGDSFQVDTESEIVSKKTMHSFQTKFDIDIELHKKILMAVGGMFIYDFVDKKIEKDVWEISKTDKIPKYINADDGIDFDDTNQFNSSCYISFNFYPIIDVLEIESGLRLDHFFAYMNSNVLNIYPVVNPRFYIAYTPVRDLKYLERITLSLGAGLYSKVPDFVSQKEYKISNFSLRQQQVLTSVLGLEVLFPLGFKIKLEGYYKFYFNRFYINKYYHEEDNEYEYINHSDGYGHVVGFDLIFQRKISKYVDGWISYSFIFARFYNPSTDDLYSEFTDEGEPTNRWYYPYYHRWHSLSIVLNIRPTPWLTITHSFGIHTGLPKVSYSGDPDMFCAVTEDDELLELYRDFPEYSDILRTGISLPLSFRISFNHYFPRTKIRFEIYGALDNILSISFQGNKIYEPDERTIINKYTGEEIMAPVPDYTMFVPSFGIKLSY